MNREDIDAFGRRLMTAMTERDFATIEELLHPEVHFRSLLTGMDGEFFGHDGVRAYFAELTGSFEDAGWEFHDVVAAEGDVAVVQARFRARGRGSGIEFDRLLPQVWRFRDGRGVGNEVHTRLDEALIASGIAA